MVVLERFCYAPEATFGRLFLPGAVSLYTVEQPWRQNEVGRSCIPEGRFPLLRDDQGRWQWFRIPDGAVPGRTAIEVHPANVATELEGCIGPGMSLGVVNGAWGVLSSREACETMASALGDYETLWIVRHAPEGMSAA